tara:strand:+ start:1412 stop:1720 length:309 start_codon:yes stop_codon:yes gene_type:complete
MTKVTMQHRITKDIKDLLERKAQEYGDFNSTSNYFHGFLESLISAFNGRPVKIPKNIFGVCMQAIKLWRTIKNPRYKKDTYDDVNGYNELNRLRAMEANDKK